MIEFSKPAVTYHMVTIYIKHILTLSAIAAVLSVASIQVRAEDCVTQYGGSQYGTNCNPNDLVINKEVQKVGSSDGNGNPVYVENLSIEDNKVIAGSYMTFRLTIKNNSNQALDNVELKDIFPPYMSYVSGGPSGTVYDAENRTMTVNLGRMNAGESRTVIVSAKVDEEKNFPAGKTNFCVVNTAQVKSSGRFDEDTAQVCVKSPDVKGITTLPKAGFNDLAMLVPFALLGVAGMGLVIKRS